MPNQPHPRTPDSGVVGVAGCGAMGLPMARRLHAAGIETWGFDVRPVAEFGDFAPRMVADPAEFAGRCDTVISVVRDARQTLELCVDRQAILREGCRPRTLLVCSTLSPHFISQLKELLNQRVELFDAPMSGAPHAAEAGTLSFMLGGDRQRLATLAPLFDAMGAHHHHLGPTGAGMTAKVLNNYVAACSVAATRRVLAAAPQLGLSPGALRDVMRTSSGGNWYADQYERISWAREGYDAGNTIGILEKDVGCALDAMTRLPEGASPLDAALLETLRAIADAPDEG